LAVPSQQGGVLQLAGVAGAGVLAPLSTSGSLHALFITELLDIFEKEESVSLTILFHFGFFFLSY